METVRAQFEPFIDEASRKFIMDGVDFQNIAKTGLSAWFPVNFALRGERADVLGGLLANLWGDWLHVTHLWVSAAVRGAGHGTSLMREAEGYARDRGAIGITLETFSFQARSFYERLGRGAQGGNHTQSPTRRTAVFPQYGGVSARHIGGGALIPTSQEPNFPIGAA